MKFIKISDEMLDGKLIRVFLLLGLSEFVMDLDTCMRIADGITQQSI